MTPDLSSSKPRLLTGDRPTGPLHIGHLVGSLEARVAQQDSHECFIIVADLHTLTTKPQKSSIASLHGFVRDVVLDQLAVGLSSEKVTFYLQSGVPAVYELAVLLQMLVPKVRLESITTLRSMARAAALQDEAMTMGLLAYPVLQAADILMARATVVPVGADNEEHVVIARECAVVFNELYGDVFPLPAAQISQWPALPGVGAGLGGSHTKMSKSLGNAIYLQDNSQTVLDKLRTLEYGPVEQQSPEQSALRVFARAFIGDEQGRELVASLGAGHLSLSAVHDALYRALEARLAPIRERRAQLEEQPGRIEEIIVEGTIRAREVANQTLQSVREAMGLESLWSGLVAATSARAKALRSPY